ncbi:MAG: hypothetical protein AAF221_13455 [Pseudomonadota bacterium]
MAILALTLLSWAPSYAQSDRQELALSGIFHRPNGTSSAVFLLPDRHQKLVSQGRLISPGLVLVDVRSNSVQIEDNGLKRWLSLEAAPLATLAAEGLVSTQSDFKRLTSTDDPIYRERILLLRSSLERQSGALTRGYLLKDERVLSLLRGANLKRGDIIKSVNGNGFSRGEDLEDFAYSWNPRGRYIYTILRDGNVITLDP